MARRELRPIKGYTPQRGDPQPVRKNYPDDSTWRRAMHYWRKAQTPSTEETGPALNPGLLPGAGNVGNAPTGTMPTNSPMPGPGTVTDPNVGKDPAPGGPADVTPNPNTPITNPGTGVNPVQPFPTAPDPADTGGNGTITIPELKDKPTIDPAVKDRILGTYDKISNEFNTGMDREFNLGAGRLTDRINQLAKQRTSEVVDDFIGRGIGASPAILNNRSGVGRVQSNAANATSEGLRALHGDAENRRAETLDRLNAATQNVLGLGGQEFDYDSFAMDLARKATEANQSARQFYDNQVFQGGQNALDRALQDAIARGGWSNQNRNADLDRASRDYNSSQDRVAGRHNNLERLIEALIAQIGG